MKHRIDLFYHSLGSASNLISKSTDSVQTEPGAHSQANVQDIQIQASEDLLSISVILAFQECYIDEII